MEGKEEGEGKGEGEGEGEKGRESKTNLSCLCFGFFEFLMFSLGMLPSSFEKLIIARKIIVNLKQNK